MKKPKTDCTVKFTLQMDWAQSDIRGAGVSPRGGHAAVAVDENWFIVGGGDNSSGE